VVDTIDARGQDMGLFYRLQDSRRFSFPAICNKKEAISPLKMGEQVEGSEQPWPLRPDIPRILKIFPYEYYYRLNDLIMPLAANFNYEFDGENVTRDWKR
jgi:hypothetical protein